MKCELNLAYRWFCKLGIEDAIPDHSAFSRGPQRAFPRWRCFRHMFERVVRRRVSRPVWLAAKASQSDASLIQEPTPISSARSPPGQDWHKDRDPARSSRAVKGIQRKPSTNRRGVLTNDVVPKFISPSIPRPSGPALHKRAGILRLLQQLSDRCEVRRHRRCRRRSRSIRQAEVGAARDHDRANRGSALALKPGGLSPIPSGTTVLPAPMLNWLVEEKGIAPHIPVIRQVEAG